MITMPSFTSSACFMMSVILALSTMLAFIMVLILPDGAIMVMAPSFMSSAMTATPTRAAAATAAMVTFLATDISSSQSGLSGVSPIDERPPVFARFHNRKSENLAVQRGLAAGRIGGGGVTGQGEGLAAATAMVDLAEFTAFAGLGHPAGAAIEVQGRRFLPDLFDGPVPHGFE